MREATPDDVAAIESLLVGADLPVVGVAESVRGFTVAALPTGEIVRVAGIEVCGGKYALLRSCAVREDWQGRGLGRRLVERAVAHAESHGIAALYLLTTTADRYFPSFGFAVTSRDTVPAEVRATDEFREACPASAIAMSKSLIPPVGKTA